jgi:hypothetical protein
MKIATDCLTRNCVAFRIQLALMSLVILASFADAFVIIHSNPIPSSSHLLSSRDSENTSESIESIRNLLNDMKVGLLNSDDGTLQKSFDTSKSKESVVRETILSTRLPDLKLNKTIIYISTIPGAGRGLFASKDIAKGEVVTCYPGDALLCTSASEDDVDDFGDDEDDFGSLNLEMSDGDFDLDGEGPDSDEEEEWDFDETIIWGSHVDEEDRLEDSVVTLKDESVKEYSNPSLTHYTLEVCEKYSIMGMPSLDSYPAYHGHFANDGAGHFARKKMDSVTNIEEEIAAYVNESIESSNAKHENVDGLHMVTVATKDIKEGDEILVTYGVDYWMEHST